MTGWINQPFPHDENLQAFEDEGNILVAVVDKTYGRSEDDEWERDREQFRLALENEFGQRFEDGNIGPGADLPAFLTLLKATTEVPNWIWIAALFFAGKPIQDGLEAWPKLAARLRPLLRIPAYLNRQGAALIAVEAITAELGAEPPSLQLLSYRLLHAGDLASLQEMQRSSEIAPAPATLYLGFVRHVFEIDAGGCIFRVEVEGTNSQTLRLS
ncbi:hypothetical protein H9L13_06840 [Sphingomonas lutea]|uniref:Uncharacterized protein n=1 Tax=Sphingomonas lutea TaxID=1045317 RepID=A0A7G9SF23_9SPHN|nr:hypothetical protein [Sphingomonas lutea]QNN66448.1 hypothetical protein H9L13_06840 [Sphingomonas lutea]